MPAQIFLERAWDEKFLQYRFWKPHTNSSRPLCAPIFQAPARMVGDHRDYEHFRKRQLSSLLSLRSRGLDGFELAQQFSTFIWVLLAVMLRIGCGKPKANRLRSCGRRFNAWISKQQWRMDCFQLPPPLQCVVGICIL